MSCTVLLHCVNNAEYNAQHWQRYAVATLNTLRSAHAWLLLDPSSAGLFSPFVWKRIRFPRRADFVASLAAYQLNFKAWWQLSSLWLIMQLLVGNTSLGASECRCGVSEPWWCASVRYMQSLSLHNTHSHSVPRLASGWCIGMQIKRTIVNQPRHAYLCLMREINFCASVLPRKKADRWPDLHIAVGELSWRSMSADMTETEGELLSFLAQWIMTFYLLQCKAQLLAIEFSQRAILLILSPKNR